MDSWIVLVTIILVVVFIIVATGRPGMPRRPCLQPASHTGYMMDDDKLYIAQPDNNQFRPIQFSNETSVPSRVDRHSSSPMSDARR